jgi:FMN-dependent NADH-azoreductase
MSTLLQINSSIYNGGGQSTQLADRFVAGYRRHHPETRYLRRDLGADGVPHLTSERFRALQTSAHERDEAQREVAAFSDRLIDELKQADVIVMGLPMYNFGIPSQLKAYFDHIARAGVTFRYTANGPEGLLTGKKAYIFAARGGVYPGAGSETQTQYVRDFLRFLGIADVEFVYAEGLAFGDEARKASLLKAVEHIERIVA